MRLLLFGNSRARCILVPRADSVPCFWLVLHEAGCLNFGKSSTETTVGDDIKASVQFFSNSLVGHFSERHLIKSRILSNRIVTDCLFSLVSGLVSRLLVKFTLVFLIQSSLVIHTIIDRVEHHGLFLNTDWKLLDLVLAVGGGLGIAVKREFLLLNIVDVGDSDGVEVTSLPEGLGSLSSVDLLIDFHLFVMMLQVAVSHHVVVSLSIGLHSLTS